MTLVSGAIVGWMVLVWRDFGEYVWVVCRGDFVENNGLRKNLGGWCG